MKRRLLALGVFCAFAGGSPAFGAAGRDPTGCPDFEVELPRTTTAEAVAAADFGFSVTNDDNAAALNRALAACRDRKASRLVLPPGTYRCFGPKGVEVSGLADFTLEGNGAVLVFWRKHPKDWDAKPGDYAVGSGPNLQVKDCRRTLVRDLVCDWDWQRHPLGFFARVVGKKAEVDGESYVDFKLVGHERYPLYPDPVPVQLILPISGDLAGGRMDGGGVRVYCETAPGMFGSRNEWLAPDTLRVWICVAQPDRPHGADIARRFTKGRNRGTCAAFQIGDTYNICHHYYGMSGMDLSACEHLTLRNVRLWSCRGHGVGIGDGLGYLSFEKFRLAPPTEAEAKAAGVGWFGPRPYTSTSDGTHCRRSRGHFRFVDCEWTLNNDDCLNFHDCTTIARGEGERTLRVANSLGTRYLGVSVGHELELLQESYEPTGWRGKVVAVDPDTMTVDRPLPRQAGRFFVVYDRAYSTDNLLFRNCRFHHAAWARNLILANNVTLEGCRFDSFIGSPLRFQTCYTPNVWCEGMGATNIVVRGCTFENCADFYTVGGVSSQIFLGLRIPSHRGWPEKGVALVKDETLRGQYDEMLAAKGKLDVKPYGKTVGGLLVERNTFVNPRGALVYAFNGDGVTVRNNRVVFDGKAPYRLLPDAGGVRADSATGVRVYGKGNLAPANEMDRGKPGEAKPLGWLKEWGRLAADGYARCMDDVDPEFARAWSADFHPRGGNLDWMAAPDGSWGAEGGAYWFDGLVRLAEQLDDPQLRELAKRRLAPVLDNMNAKSVLFNWWLDRDKDEERGWVYCAPAIWQMWAGGISERAIAAYLDVTGDGRAKRALAFAFDDPRLFTEAKVRKAPAAQAVFEAAWLTDDAGVMRTADAAAEDPMPAFDTPPSADLALSLGWKRPEIRKAGVTRHGVTTAEALLSVLRAYRWSGERRHLDAVLAWFAFLDRHALQPYGVTVSDEEWGWAGARRGSETCTVAAEPWTRTELMMLLGDGKWGDDVERAFFNAAPNCVSRDFRGHVYLQTANRTDADDFRDASAYRDFVGMKDVPTRFSRKHNPLCCTAALNRLIPNYVQSMWMKTASGGVAAALYGPSSFATDLPSGRVALRETTDYPFSETIRIAVEEAPPSPFALRLRIPGWCAIPTATLNGVPLELRAERGFASVVRTWRAGDEVSLRLPMRPKLAVIEDRNDGGRLRAAVSHGPLLYAFALPEKDENEPQAGWAEPTLGDRSLDGAGIVRTPLPQGWNWPREAPVRMKVRDAEGRPLELVPYGCAKLRISLFPWRGSEWAKSVW